jgi:hypothetical protein
MSVGVLGLCDYFLSCHLPPKKKESAICLGTTSVPGIDAIDAAPVP